VAGNASSNAALAQKFAALTTIVINLANAIALSIKLPLQL
jgi:hypothetical protein